MDAEKRERTVKLRHVYVHAETLEYNHTKRLLRLDMMERRGERESNVSSTERDRDKHYHLLLPLIGLVLL